MRVNSPDVLEGDVHRLPVLELVLKLNSLAGHFNTDEDTDKSLRQSVYHRVSLEQTLSLETDKRHV